MKIFNKFIKPKKTTPESIAFFQAIALVIYIGLVAILFWKGNAWFGSLSGYLGPVLFLTLFIVSALICGLIVFGYPIIVFWDQKKTKESIQIVSYTTLWLFLFLMIVMSVILIAQY